jgi:translation initiation factor 2 alpha subunit (eIF-2alpha)
MSDVQGNNLPEEPDEELNNSTIAGIDANNNGIRDDVELKIFEKYLKKAKMRSAMLQYAQALQLVLTQVHSEEVMKTFLEKYGSAYSCLYSAVDSYNDSEDSKFLYQVRNDAVEEVVGLVLNTEERKNQFDVTYKKYMTSFKASDRECDIDSSSLEN